jgi:hypothetical protein
VLSETARLPSTAADSWVVLSAAPLPRVTRLPWHRKRDREANDRHWARKDNAARKVPAQRGVARLLARPAPREWSAGSGTDTTNPPRVSHVSACSVPAPARAARASLRRATRACFGRGTSGATGLDCHPVSRRWASANYPAPAAALPATPWSVLIKQRSMRCSLQSSGIPEFRWATVAARLWPGAGPRAGRRQGGLGDDPSTGHRRLMKR